MTIAGHAALEVRALMRKAGYLSIGVAFAEEALGISAQDADVLMKELAALGYLRPSEAVSGPYWEVTTQGAALALAKAGAPIRRKTADRLVSEFLQRVQSVNTGDVYAYRVARVVVFGSYLTSRPDLGDIDLAVELARRWSDEGTQQARERQRRETAERSGRRFDNMVDYLSWPETEVLLFLKHRSRAISLMHIRGIPQGAETKVLYAADPP